MKIKVLVYKAKDYGCVTYIDVTEDHLFKFFQLQKMYNSSSDSIFEMPDYIFERDVLDALNSPNGKAKTFRGLYTQDFLGGNIFRVKMKNVSDNGNVSYKEYTKSDQPEGILADEDILVDYDNSTIYFKEYSSERKLRSEIETNFNTRIVSDFKIVYKNEHLCGFDIDILSVLQNKLEGINMGDINLRDSVIKDFDIQQHYRIDKQNFKLMKLCGKDSPLYVVIINMLYRYYTENISYTYPDKLFYEIHDYLQQSDMMFDVRDLLSYDITKCNFKHYDPKDEKVPLWDVKTIGGLLKREDGLCNFSHTVMFLFDDATPKRLFNNIYFLTPNHSVDTNKDKNVNEDVDDIDDIRDNINIDETDSIFFEYRKELKFTDIRKINFHQIKNYDIIVEYLPNKLNIRINNYNKFIKPDSSRLSIRIIGSCKLETIIVGDDILKLTYYLFPIHPSVVDTGENTYGNINQNNRTDYIDKIVGCNSHSSVANNFDEITNITQIANYTDVIRKESFSVDFLEFIHCNLLLTSKLTYFRNYIIKQLISRLKRFTFLILLHCNKVYIEEYCDYLNEFDKLLERSEEQEKKISTEREVKLILEYEPK